MRFGPGFLHAAQLVTWDPATISGGALSNGNLTVSATSSSCLVLGNESRNAAGKFYFEVGVSAIGGAMEVGISTAAGSDEWFYLNTGVLKHNALAGVSASTYTTGDTISVACDTTNDLLYFAKNGAWQAGGNPSAGTGGLSIAASSWFPFFSSASSAVGIANFGASAFAFSKPTGFLPWQS